jgi:hypothetical protein
MSDAYLLAKSHFDNREFRRCAQVLDRHLIASGGPSGDPRSFFLRTYALYLVSMRTECEQGAARARVRRCGVVCALLQHGERNCQSPDDLLGSGLSANKLSGGLLSELSALNTNGSLDSFGLYMSVCRGGVGYLRNATSMVQWFHCVSCSYGVLLRKAKRLEEAKAALLASVRGFPLNWSAFLELALAVPDLLPGQVDELALPAHWVSECFSAHLKVELHSNAAALRMYQRLSALLPGSSYIRGRVARSLYSLRQQDQALKVRLLSPRRSSFAPDRLSFCVSQEGSRRTSG